MMETGDAEEYEQVLMSTIKSEVLTSNACKAYFQDNPFSSVLVRISPPNFAGVVAGLPSIVHVLSLACCCYRIKKIADMRTHYSFSCRACFVSLSLVSCFCMASEINKKRADGVPPVYSPFAHGFINRFAVLDQKNSIVSSSLSDIQDKMKDLWVNGSLGLMVQKAHCLWRGRYIQCIHEATGGFICQILSTNR